MYIYQQLAKFVEESDRLTMTRTWKKWHSLAYMTQIVEYRWVIEDPMTHDVIYSWKLCDNYADVDMHNHCAKAMQAVRQYNTWQ